VCFEFRPIGNVNARSACIGFFENSKNTLLNVSYERRSLSKKNDMPIHPAVFQWIEQRISHHIVTFGSDRFRDVRDEQSDIDVAVFLPKGVTRDVFFEVFEKGSTGIFEDVVTVKQSFVPVVKFRYLQQAYDVVPICTHRKTTQTAAAYTFADLVDEIDCRAFSAVLTADVIISTIGPLRIACFRQALAAIKTLARNERVYSNPLGLLNGVALAVMLTSVFVTAPREQVLTCSAAVGTFFRTFHGVGSGVTVDLLSSTTPIDRRPGTRRPMQVFIPVNVVATHYRINTLHNVGPAQFRRIQAFLNRTPELSRNPFTMSDFFIHFHIFANHDDFPRIRTHFESTLKRVVADLDPMCARVDVFSHEMPVFKSLKHSRTSFFMGVAFENMDALLGVISDFCVYFTTIHGGRVCSDIFHRRALPSFVEF
jgi:predicted nucleotidyltransferase